jgi:hypothetical protein
LQYEISLNLGTIPSSITSFKSPKQFVGSGIMILRRIALGESAFVAGFHDVSPASRAMIVIPRLARANVLVED